MIKSEVIELKEHCATCDSCMKCDDPFYSKCREYFDDNEIPGRMEYRELMEKVDE